MSVELLALGRNVDPKTSFSTDGAGTLDLETKLVCWLGWRWKVDVFSGNVGRTIVPQREEVDVLGGLLHWRGHCSGD